MPNLLFISGSTRADSFHLKLLHVLGKQVASIAEINHLNLNDFNLPIYNGDLESESGLPQAATDLKAKMSAADGLVIGCPEYNGFMSPLLINVIDWCTRSDAGGVDLSAFSDKSVFIASASPGPGGGARSATHLKTMLSGLGAIVLPQTLSLPTAFSAFDADGNLTDEGMAKRSEKLMTKFIQMTNKLNA